MSAARSGPKGHRNLAIRGGVASCQCLLSLILVAYEINVSTTLPTSVCQFLAAITLFVQWHTAHPWMFVGRAIPSFIRSALALYVSFCGRKWVGEGCVDEAWQDVRLPFRVLQCIASLRFFLNGTSLLLQFLLPLRGVGIRGNEQLFYRGFLRALGVPLHFLLGMLKLGELTGTEWDRAPLEIGIHFIRCFILIPIASWSLLNQWVVTGSGRKTDDIRTTQQGERVAGALDTVGDFLDAHKGHRNLIIRGAMAFFQCFVTLCLVGYGIDVLHKLPLAACQFLAGAALFHQWKSDDSKMFVLRGVLSFLRAAFLVHLAECGRVGLNDACDNSAWSDIRRPFRILHYFAAVRMFLSGVSLILQFKYPERGVTAMYGNEQLFYRGCIRAFGIPIYLARAILKIMDLVDTEWERTSVEIATNFIRAFILIPIQTWSLLHQWRFTGIAELKPSQEDDEHAMEVYRGDKVLDDEKSKLAHKEEDVAAKEKALFYKEDKLLQIEEALSQKATDMARKEAELDQREKEIEEKGAELRQREAELSFKRSASPLKTSL